MEIPGTEFLTLDWIIRSIRLTTVYYMDQKRGILGVEISDAILVKRCHNDL